MTIDGERFADHGIEDGPDLCSVTYRKIFRKWRVQVRLHKVVVVDSRPVRDYRNAIGLCDRRNPAHGRQPATPLQLRLNHITGTRGENGCKCFKVVLQISDSHLDRW